jgi:hypothetical protein
MNMREPSVHDVDKFAKNPLRARYMNLCAFLTAYGLKATKQNQALIKLPHNYDKSNLLSVSIEVLKAGAYESDKKYEESKKLWLKLKKDFPNEDAPDLHLLSILLKQKAQDRLFDVDSPITNEKLLTDLALMLYDTPLLTSVMARKALDPKKRVFVARELMRRHLFDRQYASMTKLYDLKGTDYAVLKPLEKDIRMLGKNPKDIDALMNVGKYVYENYVQLSSDLSGREKLYDNDLGKFCPECAYTRDIDHSLTRYTAYDYFKDVAEALHKTGKKSELEAEALHLLVKCHRCCEWSDRCGVKSDERTSKSWFVRLHKKYIGSAWAKKTPYYY